jgi:hypothetical protein
MRIRIPNRYRDERGMSFVFVGLGFTAFLAATTLAIDVGMFMTARSQAQNAADAGALSGVVALYFNDYNNRTASGPAVQSAINTATANKVIGQPPSVLPADVTFPLSPNGQANRVRVQVFRTASHGNAVPTMMGALFGVQTVDVGATAVAEASPANAMTCVKPFMIPDRWRENTNPPWDTNDTFEMYDNKGRPLANPDVYVDANDAANYTGYTTAKDKGMLLTLRAGTGDNINPSFYYSWKMPGDVGGDFYRENIANCNTAKMRFGDLIIQEPGDKSGPTVQGIDALVAKDPGAYWDTGCRCVKGSAYSTSPRVFPIPLYDPKYYAQGKANGRVADFKIANFLGFFAEKPVGNSIPGHVTQILGIVDVTAGPAPAAAFPISIRLIE